MLVKFQFDFENEFKPYDFDGFAVGFSVGLALGLSLGELVGL